MTVTLNAWIYAPKSTKCSSAYPAHSIAWRISSSLPLPADLNPNSPFHVPPHPLFTQNKSLLPFKMLINLRLSWGKLHSPFFNYSISMRRNFQCWFWTPDQLQTFPRRFSSPVPSLSFLPPSLLVTLGASFDPQRNTVRQSGRWLTLQVGYFRCKG